MSLEEAKKVTATTGSASSLVALPRTIEDITTILNQPGQ
jgi:hypothetical protein